MQYCSYWFLWFSGTDRASSFDLMMVVYYSEAPPSYPSRWAYLKFACYCVTLTGQLWKRVHAKKHISGYFILKKKKALPACDLLPHLTQVFSMWSWQANPSLWTLLVEQVDPLLTPYCLFLRIFAWLPYASYSHRTLNSTGLTLAMYADIFGSSRSVYEHVEVYVERWTSQPNLTINCVYLNQLFLNVLWCNRGRLAILNVSTEPCYFVTSHG